MAKVKTPKYTVRSFHSLARAFASSIMGKVPSIPNGATHMIVHKQGEATSLWAEWPVNDEDLDGVDLILEAADVVYTDSYGVECVKRGTSRGDLEDYLVLRIAPEPETARKPKRPREVSSMNTIADAIALTSSGKARMASRDPATVTVVKPAFYARDGKIPAGTKAMEVVNDHGRLLKWEPKRAGFWREKINFTRTDVLPFPVRGKAEGYDKKAFLAALEKVEQLANSRPFKGYSLNRWTKERNGSVEFNYKGWAWPEGYSTYLRGGVLPSREFYRFIMRKDLDTLPSYN